MWSRKRLDISWRDLACGAMHSLVAWDRAKRQSRIEAGWSQQGDALACLSVRTGFDLFLRALDLPRGSEVLVSAVTITDMPRIIREHGLVPVPVDLDPRSMAPIEDRLRKAVTPATKAILVAHLFGARLPLEPIFQVAAEHKLLVIEDCAQAYDGHGFTGHDGADASMFSFGPIKTATALGGAVFRVRDRAVLDSMRAQQATYPVQSRWVFLRRVLKYAGLKVTSTRPVFGVFVSLVRFCGKEPDQLINATVRGFSGDGFFDRIRRQPSAPLLALLARRLRHDKRPALDARTRVGGTLYRRLGDVAACPGADAANHNYWVFPIVVPDPASLIGTLDRNGFDATQGQSMQVVEAPEGRPEVDATRARQTLARTVYLPCYPELTMSAVERMAQVVRAWVLAHTSPTTTGEADASTEGAPTLPVGRRKRAAGGTRERAARAARRLQEWLPKKLTSVKNRQKSRKAKERVRS